MRTPLTRRGAQRKWSVREHRNQLTQVITPDLAEATLARSHTLTFKKLWIVDNLKDEVNRKDKVGHEGE